MQDDGKTRWMPPLGVCCSIPGDWAGAQIREPERWSEQAGPTGSVATATRAEEASVEIGVGTGMAVRGEWIGRHPWARKASGADRCSRHGPETGGWADLHHGNGHRRPGGAAAGLLHQRGRARPTGKGDHQHRGAERGGGVGLGFHQGQLQQKAIADRTGSAAMATPISGEGLYPPAVPPWSSRWTGRPPLR